MGGLSPQSLTYSRLRSAKPSADKMFHTLSFLNTWMFYTLHILCTTFHTLFSVSTRVFYNLHVLKCFAHQEEELVLHVAECRQAVHCVRGEDLVDCVMIGALAWACHHSYSRITTSTSNSDIINSCSVAIIVKHSTLWGKAYRLYVEAFAVLVV